MKRRFPPPVRVALAMSMLTACAPDLHDDRDEPEFRSSPPPPTGFQVPAEVRWTELAIAGSTQAKVGAGSHVGAAAERSATVVTGTDYSELSAGSSYGSAAGEVSIYGKGTVTISHSVDVNGSVIAAGGIIKGASVAIGGVQAPNTTFQGVRTLELPAIFLGGDTYDLSTAASPELVELAPGSYGALVVPAGKSVQLEAGVYFFTSISLGDGGTIQVDATADLVVVHTLAGLELRGQVDISGPSENVMFTYAGSGYAWIESPFAGSVFAPDGVIRLLADEPGGFTGSFAGGKVGVDPGTQVHQRASAAWARVLGVETYFAPSYDLAEHMPATCDSPNSCCDGDMLFVEGTAGGEAIEISEGNTCVVAGSGGDIVHGWATDTTALGGDGPDLISVGHGSTVYGGGGDDFIETLGNSVAFGNAGDDTIVIPSGDNVVVGGPGRDAIHLGPGNDTIIIRDPCELEAGEFIDGGEGFDVLVSAVDEQVLAELATLEGIEEIQYAEAGCHSECRQRPECYAGTCVQDATTDALSCKCSDFASGENCDQLVAPSFEPSVPPSLTEVADPEKTAQQFVDWMIQARVGDEPAMRAELDAGYEDPDLRAAFIDLSIALAETNDSLAAVPAVEAVAYLRCRECEMALSELLEKPLPTGEIWRYDEHGHAVAPVAQLEGLSIKVAVINGLLFQGTRFSRSALLDQVEFHPDEAVRRAIIRVLLDNYGDAISSDLASRVLPSDQAEFDRPQ